MWPYGHPSYPKCSIIIWKLHAYSRSVCNYTFYCKYQSRSKHHHITDIGIVSNEDELHLRHDFDYDYGYGDDYKERNRISSLHGVIMIICSGLLCISIIGMIIKFIYIHVFAERYGYPKEILVWSKMNPSTNDESRKLKSQV